MKKEKVWEREFKRKYQPTVQKSMKTQTWSRSFTHAQLWSFTDITRSAGGWSIQNWQQLPITRNGFRNTRRLPTTYAQRLSGQGHPEKRLLSPSLDSGVSCSPASVLLTSVWFFRYFLFYLDSEDWLAISGIACKHIFWNDHLNIWFQCWHFW